MNTIRLDEEAIFQVARRIPSAEARGAYLEQVCGQDRGLRDRLDALLRVYEQERSFLEEPPTGPAADPTVDVPPLPEGPGTVIGPYKLLEPIGEGGMGVVYMAEQVKPVRRKVAMKIIKPGMDTRQVIARFEAERQALALMDHPNIARVLDAGATESGRPYFVMELVKGFPITDYCDRNRLAIEDRLELFAQVCQAVQHAHQKGIIHRDLKPSNVLVTVIDSAAVPKVIDFGVAKAMGQQLTEKTLFTGFAQLVGTPLYMSPEQAEFSGVDVDTRSDIYSLGVLLYELLTGTTPFDAATFRTAAYDEIRRIIREQEPQKPSTRLSGLGEAITTVSTNRSSDRRRLGRTVRGELDWIVMKALEKDRRRRYDTANDLAADLTRYLTDQPVEACPPSAWYRFTKQARRHRGSLTVAALMVLVLISGIAGSLWQAARATAAEQRATASKKATEATLVLGFEALDTLYAEVSARWQGDMTGRWGITLPHALLEKALSFYERFTNTRQVDATTGRAYSRMGQILTMLGRYQEARESFERAEAIWRALLAVDAENPDHLWHLAHCVKNEAELPHSWEERLPRLLRAVSLAEQLAGRFPTVVAYQIHLAGCLHSLAGWSNRPGTAQAEERLGRAREIRERLCAEHPGAPDLLDALGAIYREYSDMRIKAGRYADAEPYSRRALAIHDRLQRQHPTQPGHLQGLGWTLRNLARILAHTGRYKELTQVADRLVTISEGLANNYPEVADVHAGLAFALAYKAVGTIQSGDRAEAERAMARLEGLRSPANPASELARIAWFLVQREAPRVTEPAYAVALADRAIAIDPGSAFAHHVMGMARYRAGQWDEAIAALTRSNEQEPDRQLAFNGFFLAMAYHRKGDAEQARAWYDRAVSWLADQKVRDSDAARYRSEAAEVLGLEAPRAEKELRASPSRTPLGPA